VGGGYTHYRDGLCWEQSCEDKFTTSSKIPQASLIEARAPTDDGHRSENHPK